MFRGTADLLTGRTFGKMLKTLCESANVDKSKVFFRTISAIFFARTFYSLQKDIVRLADIFGPFEHKHDKNLHYGNGRNPPHTTAKKLGLLRC
ncbi:MAG: hypothetical protein L6V93_21305 [Clostridiales bacterium]|nr:MAG: hypothetical protein L6V93_21305 [Clostridiales bacterium]